MRQNRPNGRQFVCQAVTCALWQTPSERAPTAPSDYGAKGLTPIFTYAVLPIGARCESDSKQRCRFPLPPIKAHTPLTASSLTQINKFCREIVR